MLRRTPVLMNAEAVAPAGGAAAVIAPPVVAAPVAIAPPAATAAPTPPAASESLLQPPSATPAPLAVPAPGDAPAWVAKVPEKFHVKTAEGKLDAEATLLKQSESYTNLEKMKAPAQPPAKAQDYVFTPPEAMKDVKFDDALSAQFREKCHKAGFTQEQYQTVMQEYVETLPAVLDSVAKLSASEARAELQKVWVDTQAYEAGLANAQRAVNALPPTIAGEAWERFGRDPLFLQIAASFGKEMREDRAPNPGSTTGAMGGSEIESLMKSEAYRNPKHPEYAATTAKVSAHWKRTYGEGAAS